MAGRSDVADILQGARSTLGGGSSSPGPSAPRFASLQPTYRISKGQTGALSSVLSSARKWEKKSFKSSARRDGFELAHWRPAAEHLDDYPFARFNREVRMFSFTEAEYNDHLKNLHPGWTLEETKYLFQLCKQFDLRWPVVADRYQYAGGPVRSVEQLKDRYYGIAKTLIDIRIQRRPSIADQARRHPVHQLQYDVEKEKQRREDLSRYVTRTRADEIQCNELRELVKKLSSAKKRQEEKTKKERERFKRQEEDLRRLLAQDTLPVQSLEHARGPGYLYSFTPGSTGGGSKGVSANASSGPLTFRISTNKQSIVAPTTSGNVSDSSASSAAQRRTTEAPSIPGLENISADQLSIDMVERKRGAEDASGTSKTDNIPGVSAPKPGAHLRSLLMQQSGIPMRPVVSRRLETLLEQHGVQILRLRPTPGVAQKLHDVRVKGYELLRWQQEVDRKQNDADTLRTAVMRVDPMAAVPTTGTSTKRPSSSAKGGSRKKQKTR